MPVPVGIDRLTGEVREAQIYVAVLGAPSFTVACASWTQALPDWIDAHVRAFSAPRARQYEDGLAEAIEAGKRAGGDDAP